MTNKIMHGKTDNPMFGPYYVLYMQGDKVGASVTGIQSAKVCDERALEYSAAYNAPIESPYPLDI